MEVFNLIVGIIGTIGTLIMVLSILGADLRVFRREEIVTSASGSRKHNYVPPGTVLVRRRHLWMLLAFSVCFLVFAGIGLYQHANEFHYDKNAKLEEVNGKVFINQEVLLDGKEFGYCNFEHVTFRYNGTTPIKFHDNRFSADSGFTTDNPAIATIFYILKGMGVIPNVKVIDNNGHPVEGLQEPARQP